MTHPTDTAKSEELKACPWGHEGIVKLEEPNHGRKGYCVCCFVCGSSPGAFDTPAEAIAAWNRRSSPPQNDAGGEELKAADCPFCGAGAEVLRNPHIGTWYISAPHSTECWLKGARDGIFGDPRVAVSIWNRRHPLPEQPQEGVRGVIASLRKRYLAGARDVSGARKERTRCSHYVQALDELSDALDSPISALQAIGQEFEAGWRPIETAPKSDEPRLVRGRDWGMPDGRIHYNVAIWNHIFNEWRSADEPEQALAYLTDWLPGTPLPSAPSGEG